MNTQQKQDIFNYLEDLRESGITNMFGAGRYVEDAFDLDPLEAKEVLIEWMSSRRAS